MKMGLKKKVKYLYKLINTPASERSDEEKEIMKSLQDKFEKKFPELKKLTKE